MYQEKYMLRAIELAEKARGKCSPNPAVGAVLVQNDNIIGEGYTQIYGEDHAEVNAIKQSRESTEGADLYVTLEPCSHYGKTPPCVEAIYKAGIKNVYAGIKDPNPKVNGRGFFLLKMAGINIEYPFFEEEISNQLEYYLTWIQSKKPFVILKNAVSLDSKIASVYSDSKWITNDLSRQRVHLLRSEVDAVLTTINTVQADNPMLNVRLSNDCKQPIRVILDPFLKIDINSNIYKTADIYKTLIFYNSKIEIPNIHEDAINKKFPVLIPVSANEEFLNINEVLIKLGEMKITSVLIEAGTKLNTFLLENNLVDKLFYFIAPKILGGNTNVFEGLKKQINLKNIKIEIIDKDILIIAKCVSNNNLK